MTAIRLIGFSGEIPRLQPRQLPDTGSQYAFNCRLEDGALIPVNAPLFITSLASLMLDQIQTIYLHNSTWLGWETVVNAAPGPVATDRLYYTGDGVPKMLVSSTIYDLKITFPAAAISGVVSGVGSGDVITGVYVYTRVTSFDEESEPSPLSAEVNWQSGQTVTLSGFVLAASGRGVNRQRIYRSQIGTSGDTQLYFIAERAESASDYVDSIAPTAIGEKLPSADWNAPPDTLAGLISLPNGMMAAFVGKKLYFSEPFRPHAWPEKYILTTDYEIVGLGAYGSVVVIVTKGKPYVAQGTAPENMSMERVETNLPCINARGIVDLGYAVAYPSNDGLVVVSPGSAKVVTDNIMTRRDWQAINPGTLVASQFAGRYFACYKYTQDKAEISGTFVFDITQSIPYLSRVMDYGTALHYDVETSSLYYLIGQDIYQHDSYTKPAGLMSWKSKLFVVPTPINFGILYIDGGKELTDDEVALIIAQEEAIDAQNAAYFALGSMGDEFNGTEFNVFELNGDPLQNGIPYPYSVSATVYADGDVVATVNQFNTAVRLPSGFLSRKWEIELSGNSPVFEVIMATTARELREV